MLALLFGEDTALPDAGAGGDTAATVLAPQEPSAPVDPVCPGITVDVPSAPITHAPELSPVAQGLQSVSDAAESSPASQSSPVVPPVHQGQSDSTPTTVLVPLSSDCYSPDFPSFPQAVAGYAPESSSSSFGLVDSGWTGSAKGSAPTGSPYTVCPTYPVPGVRPLGHSLFAPGSRVVASLTGGLPVTLDMPDSLVTSDTSPHVVVATTRAALHTVLSERRRANAPPSAPASGTSPGLQSMVAVVSTGPPKTKSPKQRLRDRARAKWKRKMHILESKDIPCWKEVSKSGHVRVRVGHRPRLAGA